MPTSQSAPASPSIESSPFPLVFRISRAAELKPGAPAARASTPVRLRTLTRALAGMQKEAIVCQGQGRDTDCWRMVCDEGPYLNGTDLAPFPLAFFTAGLAADIHAGVQARLRARGVEARTLELTQDNRYTMEGSALQGTMTGAALPVELAIDGDVDSAVLREALSEAVSMSPACGLLRGVLENRFSVHHNGQSIAPGRVAACDDAAITAPDMFAQAQPESPGSFAAGIIEKLEAAKTLFGVEGGAGSSFQSEQKRQLHVRGICRLREDGLQSIEVQLLKPIGSVFRFLADPSQGIGDTGGRRAPSGLMYLSAGIAFCYMTQLGRYAHIVRKPLRDYRIVQDTAFSPPGAASGRAAPVMTHVFVTTEADDAYARQLVDMGEQTCFLHAACRSSVEVNC